MYKVLGCSPVNKRWYSLISDPNFPVEFANHKKKTTTLFKSSGLSHEDDEPPWTFITTIREFIFRSPKLSLKFLSGNTPTAKATFKDLVLCYDNEIHQGGGRVYYITNPLTKQWVALPPCPRVEDKWKRRITSTALICQPPYNHTQDYKFRVVEVCHHSIYTIDLVVYCSEIGEWKEINLGVPKEVRPLWMHIEESETVVCNGIIYFKRGLCLVSLDPFDVNEACNTTLEARVMTPLPHFGYLQESSGQLLVVHSLPRQGEPCLWYKKDGRAIEMEMVVWKLDPNQAPLVWETTFQGLCKGTMGSIKLPHLTRLEYIYGRDIGVHPYNDKLIYMYLGPEKQFVLCDTRIGCITSSKSLFNVMRFHRLEQQWWPTSVPAIVQCLTVERTCHRPLQLESSNDNR